MSVEMSVGSVPSSVEQLQTSLTLLKAVTRAVNSSLILDDIFDALGDVLAQALPFEQGVIVILDETQNAIELLVRLESDGYSEVVGQQFRFSGEDPVLTQQIHTPTAKRYQASEYPTESFLTPEDFNVSEAIVVPLINKGVVVGAMALFHGALTGEAPMSDSSAFNEHALGLLEEVTHPVAIAVENARFYVRTQRKASQEFLINQITKSIRQSLSIEDTLSTAVSEVSKVVGPSRCQILAFSDALPLQTADAAPCDTYVFEYTQPGTSPQFSASAPLLQANELEHLALWTLIQQRLAQLSFDPVVLNNATDWPMGTALSDMLIEHSVQSMVLVPVLLQESLVGILMLHQCDVARPWVQEDIELLSAISEQLGVALSQAQLFAQIQEQRDSLETALDELKQAQMHLVQSEKMAVLGQFVAGIAHEINTPLGSMMSNNATITQALNKIKNDCEPLLAQDPSPLASVKFLQPKRYNLLMELLSVNDLAGNRMIEIVKNLRNFARLDESEQKVADLHEGLDSTLVLLRGTIPAHLTLTKGYDEGLPLLQCFPGLLNQVFMNLLVNAVHATQEKDKPAIWLETEWLSEHNACQVRVRDNGKGIKPEHLSRLFDPGFTTKGRGVGTGLGLALCYRIVDKHKGRIEVDSTVGEGTEFTVTLPYKEPTSDPSVQAAS